MWKTLISVAVGGIIGATPSILMTLTEHKRFAKRLEFDAAMKQVEIYETAKQAALIEFSSALGRVVGEMMNGATSVSGDKMEDLDKAYQKALAFFSPETSENVSRAYFNACPMLRLDGLSDYNRSATRHDCDAISAAIHEELTRPYKELRQTASKNKQD